MPYIDANGNAQTCASAAEIDDSSNKLTGGWYVVSGSVPVDSFITVTGDVHLILADGASVTVPDCLCVNSGNSLTIYGQAGGTGRLTVNGDMGTGSAA